MKTYMKTTCAIATPCRHQAFSHRMTLVTTGVQRRSHMPLDRFTRSRIFGTHDDELQKMEEFRQGLASTLKQASESVPRAEASQDAVDTRDLPEVELEEYWDVVKDLSSDGRVLVMDFYTQWCGPCKLMKPTLCDWAEELQGSVSFRKFEASKKNAPVGKELGIKSVPTLIVYKDGQEVGRIVGNKTPALRDMIDDAMA